MKQLHMKHLACLLLLGPAVAFAHPGNGIVALSATSVLTGDALNNGVWRFELGQAPKRLAAEFHCHWVTRGLDGHLYAETLKESGGIWTTAVHRLDAEGRNPVAIASDASLRLGVFAVTERGVIVFQKGGELYARAPGGRDAHFAAVAKGDPPLGDVRAFAWGADRSTLYLADGTLVRRLARDGVIRVAATIAGTVTNPLYAGKDRTPVVWSLAVDGQGRLLAAVPSMDRVLRIDPDGTQSLAARGGSGWGITGVATFGSTLFLLESRTQGNKNEGPRVRMIRADGSVENLGQVD